jgi:hypothetical protein
MSVIDAYEIYCQWCRDHHRQPPTREWWDRAVAAPRDATLRRDDDFDIETERRDGWAYS